MQRTGAIVVAESRMWKLHCLYHMIVSAVVHVEDAVFLMLHIECGHLSLVKTHEFVAWPSCVLIKSGGKWKNKVYDSVDLCTKALMEVFQYSTMSCC